MADASGLPPGTEVFFKGEVGRNTRGLLRLIILLTIAAAVPGVETVATPALMVNLPLVSMDRNTFAMWTSTEPTTCFDASKAHTLTVRRGFSRHRL